MAKYPWVIENTAVLAFFTALTMAMTWPWAEHVRTHTADIGVNDPLFYTRLLRHFFAWLTGGHAHLFDADYFWPQPNVLATTDASLGILYCALPFLPFTRDLLTLVNLGVLLTFVLTGHATYLLARELTQSRPAALFAGAAFTFCFFRLHQLDHLNVLQMQWMGYALFALWKLYEKPTRAAVAWAVLALFLHGSAGTNPALYSFYLFAAAGLWFVLSAERERRLKVAAHLAIAVAASGALLWPVYGPYLQMKAAHSLTWPEWHVDVYGGRLEQLMAAPPYSKTYSELVKNLGRESYMFLGWTVIALGVVGALLLRAQVRVTEASKKPTRTAWIIAVVVTAIAAALFTPALSDRRLAVLLVLPLIGWELGRGLFKPGFDRRASFGLLVAGAGLFYLYAGLGPHIQSHGQVVGEGMWRWLASVPGFGSVRTPARFFFVVSFCAALVAAYGLARGAAYAKQVPARWAVGGLALIAILYEMRVEPLPIRPMPSLQAAPRVYRWIAEQPGKGAVLELPALDPVERTRMYQTTLFDRPIVGGEAGYRPPISYWMLHDSFADGSALSKLKTLRASGIEFVLLYPQFLGGALGPYRGVVESAGAQFVTAIDGVQVFRFPPTTSRPFTRDYAEAKVTLQPTAAAETVKADVSFVATTQDSVFEFDTRKLKLRLESEGDAETVPLYLSPPIFTPEAPQQVSAEAKLELGPGVHSVKYVVTDESGRNWAEGQGSVTFLQQGSP